ncbi:MAG: VOC family protein [Phycisphaerae bacterium]
MGIALRLDHAAIAADDVEVMAKWYARVLGLHIVVETPEKPRRNQVVYLVAPASVSGTTQGHMIEIMPRNDDTRPQRHVFAAGLSHLAWAVSDFDYAYAHLQSEGVTFAGEVTQAVGGGRLISFLDCEGNINQIVERKS